MIRIGYLIPEFPGQTHIFFWREAQALKRQGVEVRYISTRRPPRQIMSHDWSREAERGTAYLLPLTFRSFAGSIGRLIASGPGGWWRTVRAIKKAADVPLKGKMRLAAMVLMGAQLAWLARREGWRHIHVHSCGDAANIALFAWLLARVSYSITLHGPLEDYGPNQAQKWSNARFAIIITRKLLSEVKAKLAGSLPSEMIVASMGVELDKFNRSIPYSPWQGGGPCRIFSCGRLNPCKGHQDLIQALQLVRAAGIDAELHIAGEDEQGGSGYHQDLQGLVNDLNLGDSVKLLGAINEEAVRRELEDASIFALASHSEPLGVAIMEAMAMRMPVVVTNAGGVPELVNDGVDGVMVTPQEPRQLADKLIMILKNPDLAAQIGSRGRSKIETSFHSNVSADAIADTCKRLQQETGA